MRRSRSLLATLLATILLATLGSVGQPVLADSTFTPTGAVKLVVDDAARTITATVKLAFYTRSCSAMTSCESGTSVETNADDVARIVKAIERMWNNGSKVRCYTFMVKVDARRVGSQAEAGQNEVDIGLDYSTVAVRAFVRASSGASQPDPVSNAEDQRVEPAHDPTAPTTWPAHTYDQTYAHEFGHILGLNDNYDEKTKLPLPGTSDDLMFRKQGTVTDEMVKRVVERSGQVKLKDLKCHLVTESHVDPIEWYGERCEETETEWLIQGETAQAGYTEKFLYRAVIDPKSLTGTYKYEAIGSLAGGTTTKNGAGSASVVMNKDDSAVLFLDATYVKAVIVAAGTTQRVDLPLPTIAYTWLPKAAKHCR